MTVKNTELEKASSPLQIMLTVSKRRCHSVTTSQIRRRRPHICLSTKNCYFCDTTVCRLQRSSVMASSFQKVSSQPLFPT